MGNRLMAGTPWHAEPADVLLVELEGNDESDVTAFHVMRGGMREMVQESMWRSGAPCEDGGITAGSNSSQLLASSYRR